MNNASLAEGFCFAGMYSNFKLPDVSLPARRTIGHLAMSLRHAAMSVNASDGYIMMESKSKSRGPSDGSP